MGERAAPRARPSPWLLLTLSIAAFVTVVNVTMLSPLLPAIAMDLGVTDATAGLLATGTSGAAAITALIAAPWMDRYSRRTWFQFQCGTLAVGTVLSAAAPSFALLMVGRMLAGVGGGVIFGNCLAAASEVIEDRNERNRVVGFLTMMSTLGAGLGLPMITMLDHTVGWRLAILSLLPLLGIVFVGTHRLPAQPTAAPDRARSSCVAGYARVLRHAPTMRVLAAMVALFIAQYAWLIYFAAYASAEFSISPALLGAVFIAGGAAEIAASYVAPLVLRYWSARTFSYLCIVVITLNLFGVGVVWRSSTSLFPFLSIANFAATAMYVCLAIMLLDSDESTRGAAMALQSATFEIGGAIGTALFSAVLTYVGDFTTSYHVLALALPCALLAGCTSRSDGTTNPPDTTGDNGDTGSGSGSGSDTADLDRDYNDVATLLGADLIGGDLAWTRQRSAWGSRSRTSGSSSWTTTR